MLLLVLYSPVSIDGKGGVSHWLKQTLSTKGSPAKGAERPDGPVHYKSIMALVGRVYESPELVTMVQRCSDVTAAGSYDFDDVIDGGEAATSLLFDFLRQRLQANQGVATVLSTLRGIRMQMLTTAPSPHRCCQRCAGSCRLGRCWSRSTRCSRCCTC